MDVLRRNTDYALRMMVNLASHFNGFDGELTSARQLAREGNFSYQLGCKILQKLHKANLVKSNMGTKGGFALNRKPLEITLREIITVMQGGIRLNSCLPDGKGCEFEPLCEINTKLACLQLYMDGYFGGITLEEVLRGRSKAMNGILKGEK
jgi:Rrf2 family transcriptional regulator, iron-sulfur cluster assembly transcription factor